MKKNFKISLFIAIMVFSFVSIFSITKVNAAFAYAWTIDGEEISRGSSNKSGTASWVEDTNYTGGVLTLNNYNGGQLKIDCYGTASDNIFAIKLVGDNKINMPNGVGIIANFPIVFIGDGKLTINAGVPIGSGGFENGAYLTDIDKVTWNTNTTVTIEPKTTTNNDNTINEKNEVIAENKVDAKSKKTKASKKNITKKNTTKKSKNKNKNILSKISIFDIVLLSYCGVSLIIIITLVIKLKSHKKAY